MTAVHAEEAWFSLQFTGCQSTKGANTEPHPQSLNTSIATAIALVLSSNKWMTKIMMMYFCGLTAQRLPELSSHMTAFQSHLLILTSSLMNSRSLSDIHCIKQQLYTTAKNYSLLWQLHLLPELQLWHGFKGWCNVSPLSQPSMGNVGNAALVEYMNLNSPSVQRSLPL